MTTMQVVARWVCAGCGRHATTTLRPDSHYRYTVDGTPLRCGPFQATPERPIPIFTES